MYTTIEADIENGFVRTLDASRLPAHAHVLITLLPSPTGNSAAKHEEAEGRAPRWGKAVIASPHSISATAACNAVASDGKQG